MLSRPAHRRAPAGEGPETWLLPSPQRRIWALHQRDPLRLDHLVTVSLDLFGEALAPQALSEAWNYLVSRHCTLRMRVDDSAPELRARCDAAVPELVVLDANTLPPTIADEIVSEEIERIRTVPFDLRSGPVARAVLAQHRDASVTLDMVIHHIACDGASLAVLLDELFNTAIAVAAGVTLCETSPMPDYPAFASWEAHAAPQQADELDTRAG